MSVLDRAALEQSPLADLHAIASELSIDGYRRLRRSELIDVILERQSGELERQSGEPRAAADSPAADSSAADSAPADDEEPGEARRRRGRRGGRGRGGTRAGELEHDPVRSPAEEPAEVTPAGQAEQVVEGIVELLPNGSGFVRVDPPDPSDDDVYISAAQVKRCELVSGDRVTGPRRPPRRSERFASMIRIDTINGQAAEEIAEGARFDDLPAIFPNERFRLGAEDPTIKAIEWLTPFGRGSRVSVVGLARAGKTEALRRLALVMAGQPDLELFVALAGVRPEEIGDWSAAGIVPTAAVTLGASADLQGQIVERVVDQGRRFAARGANAVVLIDTLDGLHPLLARRALAAARNIDGGGSLTVVATAAAPVGGETTVIALDVTMASTARFPAIDLVRSGVVKPELLVGDAGAEAIARARVEAMEVVATSAGEA